MDKIFGFQEDNVENIFDYLMTMLDSRASRLGPVNALKSIHGDYIGGINSNFRKWFFATEMDTQAGNPPGSLCSSLAASRNLWKAYIQNLTYSGMISHVGLYLLCWGEANNIRFMPECICFIFKCCVDLLEAHEDYLHTQNDPRSFLDEVITPIYEALRNQCYQQKNDITFTSRKDHEYIIGYDDMNQMFWSKGGIEKIILKDKTKLMSQPMEKRALHLRYVDWEKCMVKNYREKRSWFHSLIHFNRVILLHGSVFWYYHSYHAYPLYTPSYLISKDNQPSIQLRLMVMSMAGVFSLIFCAFTTFCEFIIIPARWKEIPAIMRLGFLLLGCSFQIAVLTMYYFLDVMSKDSIIGLASAVSQFLGSLFTVVYLSLTPSAVLFGFQSPGSLGFKSFTDNVYQLSGKPKIASISLWLVILFSKCIESYFHLALSTREPIRELSIMSPKCISDVWIGGKLCSFQPQIVLILLTTLEFILFFVDTYLWYIIWITVFSVVRSFYLGSSIWSPWRNVFSNLPKRITSKLLTPSTKVFIHDNDDRVPKLWNTIIVSMYREHLLSIDQVLKLLYRTVETEDSINFTEPNFFISQEDESLTSSSLFDNSESNRRLKFFAHSLSTPMPQSKRVHSMPSFTVLIPHYQEKIILLFNEILREEDKLSNLTILEFLKNLHPLEWSNYMKDNRLMAEEDLLKLNSSKRMSSASSSPEIMLQDNEAIMRTRLWASLRTQTLYRTITGFMNYSRAIKLLYDLEEFNENDSYDRMRLLKLNIMAKRKFKLVVSLQRYKFFDTEDKENVELLLRSFPELQVSYIDEVVNVLDGKVDYFLCLLDGACPILPNGEREPKYRIRLSGYPILGDGKADNQNHALIFTRGEYIQLIDANQDHYFEECLKVRNVLSEFEEGSIGDPSNYDQKQGEEGHPVAIVGNREYIFSENIGILGDIAAGKEQTFGTLFARTLAYIGGKLHYGHPDFLNAIFMTTRGGVSKAQKGLHLNEDIYAGMNALSRGGRIKYCEYMQCGKGRDLGFTSILNFVTKIGAGMGEQMISRDYFYLGTKLPMDRFLSFYYAHAGFHINNMSIILSLQLFLLVGINLGVLADSSTICEYNKSQPFTDPRRPKDCLNLIPVLLWLRRCIISIFVACIISFLPLGFQELTERGCYTCLKRLGKQILSFSPFFEIFVCKIYTHSLVSDLNYGGAQYIATGRGFATQRISFVPLYSRFANASLKFGFESFVLMIYISYYVWNLSLLYFWIIVCGLLYSPFLYNPNEYVFMDFFLDYKAFWTWLFSTIEKEEKQTWYSYTKLRRGQISGFIISLLVKRDFNVTSANRPSRLHLITTIIIPKTLKTLVIGCAYLFANCQSGFTPGSYSYATKRILLVSLFPLVSNMAILLTFFVFSLIFVPFFTMLFKHLPSVIFIIVHLFSILNYIISFELVWYLQGFNICQTILSIILSIKVQELVLETMNITLLSRELDHENVCKAWWSGKWVTAGLGWRIIPQPFREFVCKISELTYFAEDFFLGQFLFLSQSPLLLIPYINKWHRMMLFWFKPDTEKNQKGTYQAQKTKSHFAIAFFIVFIMCSLFSALLVIFPVFLAGRYDIDGIIPSWLHELKQAKRGSIAYLAQYPGLRK